MSDTQKEFARNAASQVGSLFFGDNLVLKSGRKSPYFFNAGVYGEKASSRYQLSKGYAHIICNMMNSELYGKKLDFIFGPAYKGIQLGDDVTMTLLRDHGIDLGFVYDRKEAKTHGEGSLGAVDLNGAKIKDGQNFVLIDDVGTTMDTKYESLDKIKSYCDAKKINVNCVGIIIAVDRQEGVTPKYNGGILPEGLSDDELDFWRSENRIPDSKREDAIGTFMKKTNIPVKAILPIVPAVNYLYEERIPVLVNGVREPLSKERKELFDSYIDMYGVNR